MMETRTPVSGRVQTARDTFADFLARRAFAESVSIVRYRGWIADRRTDYEYRLMYDRWCAEREARVIEFANRLIRHLELCQGGTQ